MWAFGSWRVWRYFFYFFSRSSIWCPAQQVELLVVVLAKANRKKQQKNLERNIHAGSNEWEIYEIDNIIKNCGGGKALILGVQQKEKKNEAFLQLVIPCCWFRALLIRGLWLDKWPTPGSARWGEKVPANY